MTETAVLSQDLRPADYLLETVIGGHSGLIHSVRVYPDEVRIEFAWSPRSWLLHDAVLARDEVCSVRRRDP